MSQPFAHNLYIVLDGCQVQVVRRPGRSTYVGTMASAGGGGFQEAGAHGDRVVASGGEAGDAAPVHQVGGGQHLGAVADCCHHLAGVAARRPSSTGESSSSWNGTDMPKLPITTSSPSIGGRDPQIPDVLRLWYCSDHIMIRRLEALHYRCLRYVDVELGRFHILVGPNASGKSTLFDAIAFLGDLVSDGLEAAVENRTSNFQDLVWGRPRGGLGFELAVEFDIPDKLRELLPSDKDYRVFRYEVAIRETDGDIRIDSERGMLMPLQEPQHGDPARNVSGPDAAAFVHTDRWQSPGMAHHSEQVDASQGQLQYRDLVKAGKGMGDQHRVWPPAFGARQSPRVSDELPRFDVRQESVGKLDKVVFPR